ncbi:hypothetical protein PFISCL1PPCAC_25811, partial [Pristionchus fissidentatus]
QTMSLSSAFSKLKIKNRSRKEDGMELRGVTPELNTLPIDIKVKIIQKIDKSVQQMSCLKQLSRSWNEAVEAYYIDLLKVPDVLKVELVHVKNARNSRGTMFHVTVKSSFFNDVQRHLRAHAGVMHNKGLSKLSWLLANHDSNLIGRFNNVEELILNGSILSRFGQICESLRDGGSIEKLTVEEENFDENCSNAVLELIQYLSVKRVELIVKNCTGNDPYAFLLRLSDLAEAVSIVQQKVPETPVGSVFL